MIKGITHDSSGNLKEKVPIVGKIVTGRPPSEDRNYPEALDHFEIKKKRKFNQDIEWVVDQDMMDAIDPEEGKPDSILVSFFYDDPEKNLRSTLQWWKGRPPNGHLHCYGDGETARRWDEVEEKRAERGCPCPKLDEGKCKPNGQMKFVILEGNTNLGSAYAYYTTSARTIRQLYSDMEMVKSFTNGRLRGVPLELKLEPDETKFRDNQGNERTTIHYFAYLELNPELLGSDLQTKIANKMEDMDTDYMPDEVGNASDFEGGLRDFDDEEDHEVVGSSEESSDLEGIEDDLEEEGEDIFAEFGDN